MNGIFDAKNSTDEEIIAVMRGMLNAKNEWLERVEKREKELGIL